MNPARSKLNGLGRDLLLGSLVAGGFLGLAVLCGQIWFGRPYYIAVFLPFFMMLCLLLAWIFYLRDDGFIRRQRVPGENPTLPPSNPDMAAPMEMLKTADTGNAPVAGLGALYAPRDGTILPRSDRGRASDTAGAAGAAGASSGSTRRVLFLAAIELGLLSLALYTWAGIGDRYFLP